ncbi:embryo-specific protein ATS3A-like [Bidens hawaiensis]|uniref:embryo-specific protein ATS3A-like n=1 Tax=Bidens hawaiensis TaxID=980011 RepID=UPI0040491C69
MMRAVCFVVLCALISTTTNARSTIKSPLPNHKNQGTCSFTVKITTSCSSVPITRDQISLSFGDSYGNQVYAPRIDDPSTRTFERCSADTFEVYGPCARDICYVHLYRSGYDGWKPARVEIYGAHTRAVSFEYNDWIPAEVWDGFDYCRGYAAAAMK